MAIAEHRHQIGELGGPAQAARAEHEREHGLLHEILRVRAVAGHGERGRVEAVEMGEGRVGVEPHDGVPGSGEWGAAGTVGKWAPIGDDGSFREPATALLRRVYGVASLP